MYHCPANSDGLEIVPYSDPTVLPLQFKFKKTIIYPLHFFQW